MLYTSRFVLGFSQAFVVIYAPVWINEFSPAEANTRWMAGLHSACVVGILGGYIVSQLIVNHFSFYVSWRFSIYVQGCFQFLLSFITMFVDNRNLDVKYKTSEEHTVMINQSALSDKEARAGIRYENTNITQHASEKRVENVNSEDIGHLCHQFRILCSNFVFIFVTL